MYKELLSRLCYQFASDIKDPKEFRDHFVFKFDKKLEANEVKKFEDRIVDVEHEEQNDDLKLCFIKLIKDKTLLPMGEIFINVEKPFNIQQIASKCKVEGFDPTNVRLFYEPCS